MSFHAARRLVVLFQCFVLVTYASVVVYVVCSRPRPPCVPRFFPLPPSHFQVQQYFSEFGDILECSVVKDRATNTSKGSLCCLYARVVSRALLLTTVPYASGCSLFAVTLPLLSLAGCAFVTYTTKEAAERAMAELHGKRTIPGVPHPVQCKVANSETGPCAVFGGVPCVVASVDVWNG
jgi:hypothetical protein